jgi:hypothetical protein
MESVAMRLFIINDRRVHPGSARKDYPELNRYSNLS